MDIQEVKTRIWRVGLRGDGILQSVIDSGATETLADAQEALRQAVILSGRHRRPILVDIRGIVAQDREARAYYGQPETVQSVSAVALLTGSRVSTLLGNFFLNLTKRNLPTKLFTDEAEAIAWLKGYVA